MRQSVKVNIQTFVPICGPPVSVSLPSASGEGDTVKWKCDAHRYCSGWRIKMLVGTERQV